MEYLLYGLAQGESRDYMETLLFVTTDEKQIEPAKRIIANDGWHSFRVSTYNGEKPDFTKALNI